MSVAAFSEGTGLLRIRGGPTGTMHAAQAISLNYPPTSYVLAESNQTISA